MRKEGGFTRCRVILANHPELYPLERICAWLHHETTGLWPNEGCHHPGMKNCRKKLQGVSNGSVWNDSQWNERLANLGDGKSLLSLSADELKYLLEDTGDDEKNMQMMEQFAERLESENQSEPDFETDDEEKANEMAYMALRKFMDDEPEFVSYMTGDDNWVMEGEDDDDLVVEKPFVRGDKDDCGCGGSGEGHNSMIASIVSALSGMMKQLDEDERKIAGLYDQIRAIYSQGKKIKGKQNMELGPEQLAKINSFKSYVDNLNLYLSCYFKKSVYISLLFNHMNINIQSITYILI
jgi:hypothetical protein